MLYITYTLNFLLMIGMPFLLAAFLVLRFWLKRDRSWRSALMFGAGHGGVESIIVGLITAAGVINIFVYSNVDLAQLGVTAAQLPKVQAQIAAAWAVPPLYPLLGAAERVSPISTHLFLAVLVMQVFLRRNYLFLATAILWHALTDGVAVYAASTWGALPTEAAIAVLALVGLGLLFALRAPEPIDAAPGPADTSGAVTLPSPLASGPLLAGVASADQLDRTRFQ